MSLLNLKKKVVLVTGGYGHLGSAMCQGLANEGAIVYALGKSEKKFKSTFKNNNKIKFITCDISDTNSIKQTFSEIYKINHKIDILINNAIYLKSQNPLKISDEDWSYSIGGVLDSVYRCIREIAPYFKEKKQGKIINIGSMYGMISPDFSIYNNHPEHLNPPHYGAGKAGVIQLTKYFAQYLGQDNIQINSISPGPFPNKETQKNKEFIKELKNKTALKRIGKPEDLIGSVVFLSSDASNYITGHNLVVDGGWTIS